MVIKIEKSSNGFIKSEVGTIQKNGKGRTNIALVYPNQYHVGMSNLGFQATYLLFNQIEDVACERSFLPQSDLSIKDRITTVESGRPLANFDIVAFSISFENDYSNILTILENSGIPLRSNDRKALHPLIIAGGVACFLNPEPLAPFIDCFLIGEAEEMLNQFSRCLLEFDFRSDAGRDECLKAIARTVPGAYIPAFYKTTYHADGIISAFEPLINVPQIIKRTFLEDLNRTTTCSSIVSPDTTFERTFLIEVGRGCPHGCRFCGAGFIYRPPRFRPVTLLQECLQQGRAMTDKIGLVGTAVSDLPGIGELCEWYLQKDVSISFSSLRADALNSELVSVLRRSNVKTATIAPDAGSERMRRVINKGITEEDVITAVENLVASDILNLKLYFMVGLPGETMDDVEEIINFCKRIKHKFLKSSRPKKRIGEMTVSLNSFVPKPFTPFQWVAMDDVPMLKEKIKKIKNGLRKVANLRVHADVPRWAYIQALLSRGDRKVADILSLAHENRQNWPQTLKATPINSDFYVLRERALEELLPWDLIDHGVKKSYLAKEYKRAREGKISPPCPMESCDICGVCSKNNKI